MSLRRASAWLGVGLCAGLTGLALAARPDGSERAGILQFVGRLHPLAVHLPIALALLVPILELAALLPGRGQMRSAASLVAALTAAASIFAAFDGWLLAWSGGYSGATVTRHMLVGVALAWACALAWWHRTGQPGFPRAFAAAGFTLASLALVVWAGDLGGRLTHGERYLSEYMPGRLRSLLRMPAPEEARKAEAPATAAARTVYTVQVAPILAHSCASCHNPDKTKGDLNLATYADLMRGGKDGAVVSPWRPEKSELMRRVALPKDDEEFMPSNGKNPLGEREKEVIRKWIADGASADEPLPGT